MNTTAVSPAEIDAFLTGLCEPTLCRGHLWGYPREKGQKFASARCMFCQLFVAEWDGVQEHEPKPKGYSQSLDALFAPGGPVEKCMERGLLLGLWNKLGGPEWCAHSGIYDGRQGDFDVCLAPTPALALAEACYNALK